ncbi:MAG TPA: hypothetical protein PKN32_01815 [Bacteroidales bacterium]|nr:hypothetical protein [Bacteroidales bacterium]
MKVLSIIAIIIAAAGIGIAVHNQINIIPLVETTEGDSLWMYYHDLKMMLGNIAMLTGLVSIIGGVIAGIKKQKLGWIGVILGLVSLVFGLSQATHMFS